MPGTERSADPQSAYSFDYAHREPVHRSYPPKPNALAGHGMPLIDDSSGLHVPLEHVAKPQSRRCSRITARCLADRNGLPAGSIETKSVQKGRAIDGEFIADVMALLAQNLPIANKKRLYTTTTRVFCKCKNIDITLGAVHVLTLLDSPQMADLVPITCGFLELKRLRRFLHLILEHLKNISALALQKQRCELHILLIFIRSNVPDTWSTASLNGIANRARTIAEEIVITLPHKKQLLQ